MKGFRLRWSRWSWERSVILQQEHSRPTMCFWSVASFGLNRLHQKVLTGLKDMVIEGMCLGFFP